jgi:hypothetical protein
MLKIKNWTKFQHFKNRTPPWIKVYRDLLNDLDWFSLDDKSARCLIMLWLIASEDKNKNGELPDVQSLAFRLRMSEKDINTCIKRLCKWVLQDDITAISERYHDGLPETERETEKEGEIEANVITSATIKNFKSLTNQEFIDQCQKTGNTILEDVDAIAFCRYWMEPDAKGRMRFQLQKTWDTSLRMHTWKRNAENMAQRKVVQ